MSDPSGTGGPGAEPRPRPQYGEYAPPGWVSPVTGEEPSSAPEAAPTAPQQQPVQQAPAPQQGAYDWGTPKPVRASGRLRTGDLVASVLLLGVGLAFVLSAFSAAATDIGPQLLAAYRSLGFDTDGVAFDFGNSWAIIAGVGTGLWLGAAVWTVRRLRARKLAFWVPLAAGALFFIVQFVILAAVVAASPGVMEMFSTPPSS